MSLFELMDTVYDVTNTHNEKVMEVITKISRQLVDNGKIMSELMTTNKNLKRNIEHANQENKKLQKQNESSFEVINNQLKNISGKLQNPSSWADLSNISSFITENAKNLIDSKDQLLHIQKCWTQREIDSNNKRLEIEVLSIYSIISYTILTNNYYLIKSKKGTRKRIKEREKTKERTKRGNH
jgi:hypothetical protein